MQYPQAAAAVAEESLHTGVKVQHLGAALKALSDGSQSMEAELAKHFEVLHRR